LSWVGSVVICNQCVSQWVFGTRNRSRICQFWRQVDKWLADGCALDEVWRRQRQQQATRYRLYLISQLASLSLCVSLPIVFCTHVTAMPPSAFDTCKIHSASQLLPPQHISAALNVAFSQDQVSQSMRAASGAVRVNKQPTVTKHSLNRSWWLERETFSVSCPQIVRHKLNLLQFAFQPSTSSQGQGQVVDDTWEKTCTSISSM